MTTFERIKLLANKQGKSVKDVARDLNFGESTIYKWKMQSPKGVDLEKVADYFNVSVDYLLGRTDIPGVSSSEKKDLLDPEEDELIVMFRKNTSDMDDVEKKEFNESLDKLMSFARDLFERDKKMK
ncbi:hypothetical protein IGJ83_002907 [Enterococcus pernyi]